LLIVMFAQYVEIRAKAEKQTQEVESTRAASQAELDEAVRQLVALRERLQSLQHQVEEADARATAAEGYRVQRDLIGEMVGDIFHLPDAALKQLMQQRRTTGPGPTSDDVAQAQERWKAIIGNPGPAIVDHLLTFGELRKRVDVWELYVQDNGTSVLTVGPKKQTFRAENAAAYSSRLFDAYKALPEPKSMVLVMVSYGDAQFGIRKAALDGVPAALERIRKDIGNRSRFEYAVLGFRPTAQ
jgi:hypothetical protein